MNTPRTLLQVFREMLGDIERGFLADATYVIEGPPGAGKAALMVQFVSELTTRPPTNEGRAWLPVVVHSSITSSAPALGREIDRAIACHQGFTDTGVSIGPDRDGPNATIAAVAEDRHGAWDAYQTVLFVVEGQDIPAPPKASAGGSRLLSVIHEGRAEAPLSLCVFGRPGVWQALNRVGITRTVAERHVCLGEPPDAD